MHIHIAAATSCLGNMQQAIDLAMTGGGNGRSDDCSKLALDKHGPVQMQDICFCKPDVPQYVSAAPTENEQEALCHVGKGNATCYALYASEAESKQL